MDYIRGRIFTDPALPQVDASERRAIYRAMTDVLANLHSMDPEKLDLGDFGKQDKNYMRKQLSIWTQQYRNSETHPIQEMEDLMTWLDEVLEIPLPSYSSH